MTNALIKFSDFVAFPLKCFKVLGLSPADPENGSRGEKVLKVYHVCVLFNLFLCLCMASINAILHFDDLAMITESFPSSGYAGVAIVKSLAISMGKKEFLDLMETFDGLFPKSRADQEVHKVRNYFRGYKLMERMFGFFLYSVAVSFFAMPIFKLFATGVWINKLPYINWFPFDEYDPRYYNFVFIWQFLMTVFAIASLLGPDLILYAFVTLVVMQFDILCRNLQDLDGSSSNLEFVKLAKLHITLIKSTENLQKIYSVSIFANFSASSILICLVGYQVSAGISYENLIKFIIFLMASMIQILILCYYGERLATASGNVVNSVYGSKWFEMTGNKRKNDLLLMMQRSQKPSVITAYKFSVVSLPSFTAVS